MNPAPESHNSVLQADKEHAEERTFPPDTFVHVIANAPLGIYLVDADFRLAHISAGCAKVFGGIDPLIGRDFAEILRIIWSEPFASEAIELFRHTLSTGEPYRSPDTTEQRGNVRVVESYDWQIERAEMPDGRLGVVCYFYETTERVQAEQDAQFLADLTERCRAATDSRALMGEVVRETGLYLGADRCFINEIFPSEDRWTIREDFYRDGGTSLAGEYKLSDYDPGSRASLSAGVIEVIDDTKGDPRSASRFEIAYRPLGVHAVVVVPLLRNGNWVANFIVSSESPRGWQSREVSLLETVSERVWNTVERNRAEEELLSSRAKLDTANKAARMGSWELSLPDNRLIASDTCKSNYGRGTDEEFTYDDLIGSIHPDDRERWAASIGYAIDQCSDFEVEYRTIWPDRSVHWVLVRGDCFRGIDGRTSNLAGVSIDITERKGTDEALRESEARFRKMADDAPVMIWVTEPDGSCTYLSQSWYNFTGQTPETGLGMGWVEATHPDDAANAEQIFLTANEQHGPFRVEYRLRRSDGQYRWAIDSAQPRFGSGGEFLGYIGSVIDIDERKKAEEELRRTQERFDIVKDSAEVGFWFCDLPFDKLIWDNRVKEHFWLAPETDVTIDTFYDSIHPGDRERTRNAIAESIANRTRYDIEYRTVSPQNEEKLIRAIGRTFYDEQGGPIRFDGVTFDITELRRAEIALRDRELLESAVRFQQAERYRIARDLHDHLGQQLTGLRLTLVDLMESAADAPHLREKIERAQENALTLDRDVSSLAFELRANIPSEQSLADALENFVSEWSRNYRIEANFHAVNAASGRRLPDVIETHLYRIAQEALNNTTKHANATNAGVILDVSDNTVRLIVEDNGVGFDVAANSIAKRPNGHGLGLMGMQERVELLDGSIEIDSKRGKGTTVFVTIPLNQGETAGYAN